MRDWLQNHKALGTITTTLILLVATATLGTGALVFSNGGLKTFEQTVSNSFSSDINRVQESLVIENMVYHSSTQQFNFTFTNTGSTPVNVTSIAFNTITTPSFNVTAITSSSVPVSLISQPSSLSSTSEGYTVPGSLILPHQSFTTLVPYHCFSDPVKVTAKTSRGNILTSTIVPNVGWYDSNEPYRKRITVNYTKVVGNPLSIILDNEKNASGTTSSNQFTLSSFTINPGNNRLLVVVVQSNTGTVASNGITYAGQTLTMDVAKSNTVDSEIWYLKNPPAGTANIVVTMSTSASIVVGAFSYFGVDQTTPLGAIQSTSGSSTSESINITPTYFNSTIVDSIAVAGAKSTLASNTGQTNQWKVVVGSAVTGGSSSKFVPVITSTSMGWSWSGAVNYAVTAVEIRSSAFIDFPLVINMTDTNLSTYAQSNGNDIVFTNCDGVTKLNYEIENFTKTTGNLQAWVQLPQLYSTPQNIIYMYYGNSNVQYQQNVGNTWDSTYFGVWHMQQNPGNVIQIDNVQNQSGTTVANVFVFNGFTVHSGKAGLLLVEIQADGGTVSSVTYGISSLTKAIQVPGPSGTPDSEIWYLTSPPTGTANIVVTTSLASTNLNVGAYSLFNIDQSNPLSTTKTNNGNSKTGGSLSLTTTYPNSWVIDSLALNAQTTITPGGGQSLQYRAQVASTISGGSSSKSTTVPGSVSMSWSWSQGSSTKWALGAVELKAAPTIIDSTSNHNDFTNSNFLSTDQIQGELGYGLNFDGQNNYLSRVAGLTNPPNTQNPQTASIWFWIPTSNRGSFAQDIFTLETTGGGSAIQMGYKSSTTFDVWKYGGTVILTTSVPSAGHWHNAVYTYDGNNNGQGSTHRLYIDGNLITTSTTSPQTGTPGELFVGSYDCQSCELLNSKLDEFEYSTVVRSASWIATEYNNQASPSTFVALGPQESVLTPRISN